MLLEFLTITFIVKGLKWLKNKKGSAFLEWEDYNKKIQFLDIFYFQQKCRKQSIRNSEILKIE